MIDGKRAQGTEFWIIIGAALALIVLVVVLMVFTRTSGTVQQGLLSCESKQGQCLAVNTPCPAGKIESSTFTCPQNYHCCL